MILKVNMLDSVKNQTFKNSVQKTNLQSQNSAFQTEQNCSIPSVKTQQIMNGINFTSLDKNSGVKVSIPKMEMVSVGTYAELSDDAFEAVKDVSKRVGKEGQFLSWIDVLPNEQLKNLDNIYAKAQEAKKGGMKDLVVIGIGGSRHTTEALTKMLGVDRNIHFYSAVDENSFENLKNSIDLDKTQFIVVSKSGGTRETNIGYEDCKKLMQTHLGKEDVSDRFYAFTDKSDKSKLRQKVNNGELKDGGLVHDDVGGRFSIFDDATLFTLAFAGVDKKDVAEMLKSSIEAQKDFLEPDYDKNDAMKLALSKAEAAVAGKNIHFSEYFGDAFYGTTLWETQLKNESLKSKIFTASNVGPAYLHYNAESDLDDENKKSAYSFIYTTPKTNVEKAIIGGVVRAYENQGHPVSKIELDDLSPKNIARFIELKHFETLYTGNILRKYNLNFTPENEAMPEVLQPNVEKYKIEVNAEYERLSA